MARLRHKERWLAHGEALRDALSVCKSAAVCDVSVSTGVRWRHRFLRGAKTKQPSHLSGIVEADETFFQRSFKGSRRCKQPAPEAAAPSRKARHRAAKPGRRSTPLDELVPVLVVRDRERTTGDAILDDLTARTIGAKLLPILVSDVLLCGYASGAYATIACAARIHHEPVNTAVGERVRDRVCQIQNVNANDSQLTQWIRRFNGVATEYLDSYLGWRRLIERERTGISAQEILLSARRFHIL